MMSSGRLFPSACCLSLASSLDSYLNARQTVHQRGAPKQGRAHHPLHSVFPKPLHVPHAYQSCWTGRYDDDVDRRTLPLVTVCIWVGGVPKPSGTLNDERNHP